MTTPHLQCAQTGGSRVFWASLNKQLKCCASRGGAATRRGGDRQEVLRLAKFPWKVQFINEVAKNIFSCPSKLETSNPPLSGSRPIGPHTSSNNPVCLEWQPPAKASRAPAVPRSNKFGKFGSHQSSKKFISPWSAGPRHQPVAASNTGNVRAALEH